MVWRGEGTIWCTHRTTVLLLSPVGVPGIPWYCLGYVGRGRWEPTLKARGMRAAGEVAGALAAQPCQGGFSAESRFVVSRHFSGLDLVAVCGNLAHSRSGCLLGMKTRRKTQSFFLPWWGQGEEGKEEGAALASCRSRVCAFCSFQGARRKKADGKAAAREVALLMCLGF